MAQWSCQGKQVAGPRLYVNYIGSRSEAIYFAYARRDKAIFWMDCQLYTADSCDRSNLEGRSWRKDRSFVESDKAEMID